MDLTYVCVCMYGWMDGCIYAYRHTCIDRQMDRSIGRYRSVRACALAGGLVTIGILHGIAQSCRGKLGCQISAFST